MLKSKDGNQMTTTLRLQVPIYDEVDGVKTKDYQDAELINCNWKTFGGTEEIKNSVLGVIKTAQVTCWFNPNIKSDCRVVKLPEGAVYEILGDPENFEDRGMQMTFKVRRIAGGA